MPSHTLLIWRKVPGCEDCDPPHVIEPFLVLWDIVLVPAGHAVEEILNTADKEKYDMIVLGTYRKGFLAHTFLGSIASLVLYGPENRFLSYPCHLKELPLNRMEFERFISLFQEARKFFI